MSDESLQSVDVNSRVSWNYPTSIVAGSGCLADIGDACFEMGIRRPLIITDPGIAALPVMEQLLGFCLSAGLGAEVFSQVKGNPTGSNVSEGVESFKRHQCDGVIAFGGGSALDTAKAVALMVGQARPLWDFEDVGDNWTRVKTDGVAPVIAVPTTAGTGSEVGRASVITHEDKHEKKIIFHPSMLPGKVLLDPMVTTGLPAKITAATGMDALSHNLEAYCSSYYHPMADGIAIEAMTMIKTYLPQAVADGGDVNARMQMLVASTMGATAFQKGLGAMHALAHTLGGLYDAHHGLLNAILMPYVLQANRSAIEKKMMRLGRCLGLSPTFDAVMQWIVDLRKTLDIPHTLQAINITADDSLRVGELSEKDPAAGGNPIIFSAGDYTQLFKNAVEGRL